MLAHTSIQAIEQAPPSQAQSPAPAAPVKSSFITTIAAAATELTEAIGRQHDMAKQLEIYSKFEFSPALQLKLKDVFGSERPFLVQRTNGPKGQITYASKLKAHSYLDENATAFSWAELNAKSVVSKGGTVVDTSATWPSLSVIGTTVGSTIEKISVDFKHSRAKSGLWYGAGGIKIGSMVMRSVTTGASEGKQLFRVEGFSTAASSTPRGKLVDMSSGFSIKAIIFGDDRVERVNFGVRMVNMPAQAMADLDRDLRQAQGSGLAPDAQADVMLRTMKSFGKNALAAGASVVIDDISAGYHGNTASIKGRVDFDKVVEADFDAPIELGKKIIGRFDVRLPVAMVNDVSRLMASKQVDAAAPNSAEQIDLAAKNIAGLVIGKLVNEGFAVMEKGELRSTIEIKNGKVTFNGKIIPIPGMPNGDLVQVYHNVKAAPAPVPAKQ
ncbi:DUF945 family protein [Duganella sp. BJB475]|nr:DUF945 family protein [Duganella sp. BJB475]RFP32543.1 DUF945 family protein [Duganella sp. BJB476]